MQFNEYLKSCRDRHNLTQEQLVQELYNFDDAFAGLDVVTLSRWERGVSRPSLERQVRIVKWLQNITKVAFPGFDMIQKRAVEDELCIVGVHNIIGKNKRLVMNFPSHIMKLEELKLTHLRHTDNIDHLLKLPHNIHKSLTDNYMQLQEDHLRSWALHPSNLFLVVEYQTQLFGMLFALRLKPEVFEKVLNFEMNLHEISDNDFASFDEVGCNMPFLFFAYSDRVAALLMLRYYAHLIANQDVISEVGALSFHDEGRKLLSRFHLQPCKNVPAPLKSLASHRGSIDDVLVNEDVLKMIFLKQECPEDKL